MCHGAVQHVRSSARRWLGRLPLAGRGAHLAMSAADLLTLLVQQRSGGPDPRAPEAARGMLTRVKEYVLRHLADPGLSPDGIAAAHHVSVRYLHKLFQFEGVTLTRWIQRERLRMCRRDLSRASGAAPTVAAVAQRWGFVSPAHFSRVFRAAYGLSPREWQVVARTGSSEPPAVVDMDVRTSV
jgi:AraC-like DNA-binding protein